MEVSCLPVSYFDDIARGRLSLEQWFELAKSLGLDGADLSVALLASRNTSYLRELRRQAESRGLFLGLMSTYTDFSHPETTVRERAVADFESVIDIATVLGLKAVRITAGQNHPGLNERDGIEWVVDCFLRIADWAQQADVMLVYENHTKGYTWQYRDFSQPESIFVAIAERIRESPIRINFDTASPFVNGTEPLSLLNRVIDRVFSIHAHDVQGYGPYKPAVTGCGAVPFPAIFDTLIASGFDGLISIEENSRTGDDGFRIGVDYVRRTWASRQTA